MGGCNHATTDLHYKWDTSTVIDCSFPIIDHEVILKCLSSPSRSPCLYCHDEALSRPRHNQQGSNYPLHGMNGAAEKIPDCAKCPLQTAVVVLRFMLFPFVRVLMQFALAPLWHESSIFTAVSIGCKMHRLFIPFSCDFPLRVLVVRMR